MPKNANVICEGSLTNLISASVGMTKTRAFANKPKCMCTILLYRNNIPEN